jgi:thymidylate kinase
MIGDTDLDILFDINQKERLEIILSRLGFKKFNSVRQKQYKDIDDFIGLDIPTGKIVHLHAHFRLTLGEPYLKSYQLNLEDLILKGRVFDDYFGIYCIHPAFEFILLYFREALKFRNRDILMLYLFNKIDYSEYILREYRWLKERCSKDEIKNILGVLFSDYEPIYKLLKPELNRKVIFKLSHLIKRRFENQRLFSPAEALMLRWYREISLKVHRKFSLLFKIPVVTKRINQRGGLVIAVVGADGSGKSTVVSQLRSTFKPKLDVYNIYFGRGDGSMSWQRRILVLLKLVFSLKRKKKNVPGSEFKSRTSKKGLFITLFKITEAFVIAREKLKNLNRMHKARNKGMLVICDRFPQNQIMGYNDGPLLHQFSSSSNPLFRMVSKKESCIYADAENNPPDIVFKLIADAKVVEERKPNETPFHILEEKIKGIKELNYAKSCKVISIDASQPLIKVLEIIKGEIWKAYP